MLTKVSKQKLVFDFHENSIETFYYSNAVTLISLEITNSLKNCDNGYIDIRCVVKSELVAEIISISLKRQDKDFVSVSDHGVWEDTELINRSGVAVSSFIRDLSLSYLSIRIMSSVVKPLKDKGPYQCVLFRIDTNGGLIKEHSTLENLNISGNLDHMLCVLIWSGKRH